MGRNAAGGARAPDAAGSAGHFSWNSRNSETGGFMLGLMQNRPLLISNLVDYVATWHAETEIVSRDPANLAPR